MRSNYDAYDPEHAEDPKRWGTPQWKPPRLGQEESVQEAANMADRFNR